MQKTKTIKLSDLDRTPIGEIIGYSAKELFRLQEEAEKSYDKSLMRKKWIDGVIQLKYKTTINELYKRAMKFVKANTRKEKFDGFIQEGDSCIRVEFHPDQSYLSKEPNFRVKMNLINNNQSNRS